MAKNNSIRRILLILVMFFVMIIPSNIFANETNVELGDINNDTKIDISDLTLVLRHISATKTNKNNKWILSDEKFKAADIDKNNKIDSSDVLSLLRYIAANKSEKIAEKHKEWLNLEPVKKEEPQPEPEKQPEQKIEVISIQLNKKSLSIKENLTEQLTVEIKPENATNKTIEWSSSNPDIATVDANGNVKALKQGSVRIIAKSANGKTATCYLSVKKLVINAENIKLDKTSLEIKPGDTNQLIATIEPANVTDKTITWISSNTKVATIDSSGKITAKAEGKTTITAKTVNGKRITCEIIVKEPIINVSNVVISKTSAKIDRGDSTTLTVSVQPSNATDKTIRWSTSNSKVATVSNGKVSALAKGTAQITATASNGKTATCTITVNDEVVKKLDGKNVTLPLGDKVYFLDTQYKYKADDGTTQTRGSDCIIIESNGKYGMIDTATDKKPDRIVKYLKELKIKELEFVLITHAHSDHIGGYKAISKKVKIKNLYIKKLNSKNEYYNRVKNHVSYAKDQGTKVHYVNDMKDKTITLGNFEFKLFNTTDKVKTVKVNENVNSIVALVTINGKTIYFAGDIQDQKGINSETIIAKEVQSYLKTLGKKSVDVYKAAHHSYDQNNKADAVKRINPVNAVVTNKNNRRSTLKAKDRIKTYVDKNKGKMYYTESGTVILNISKFGDITFKKLSNYYK